MPPRRKASGPAASARSQGTLSFSGVTKASKSAPVTSAKQNLIDTTSPKAKVKQDAVEIELAERTKDAEVETPEEEVKVPAIKSKKETKSKEILEAEKITDAKVKKYWKEEENKRKAPRVHQQGLTVHEKILRHFDLSSQFGVCYSFLLLSSPLREILTNAYLLSTALHRHRSHNTLATSEQTRLESSYRSLSCSIEGGEREWKRTYAEGLC